MTPPIDLGSAATNRTTTTIAAYTYIDLANPANESGFIHTVEFWFNTNATGVKVGTFSGSAPNFTPRDVAVIGNVTGGSKQTFSGLSIAVAAGDFIGIYFGTGTIEYDETGGTNVYIKAGDQFGAGTQTYTQSTADAMSVYGFSNKIYGAMNII